ncbi:2-succinyl-5-enolpyruvyl-6-hydroxy-3-cyclohexene-1-carboxylate synthase [Dyadobacter jejuensis]|uniref:2-succinyl-5-enolpyruvyl-6-hydroxy-3-cyclohexene-1-carboxylate synthase n=1 Tax=Dyadobacter jejuensis TaxID=1082580 RepID=A0A316AQ56_9BACT|nr:2-succinyl-5-enolpyruvyl-6-hydroxy-3-cyclohexene-1-carboxylic-acid synthase [Dyadobacter jejuensis]PWJ58960.1 2-succinyl-5-enolpyruvyl-6-hydroxy-3-cyclohexene-1-carboxylate synthase [Dyadobacter jejuensis]
MAVIQPLIDLAELLFLQGVRHVVLSPGSRSAAISLAFIRHGGFQVQAVMDERSAGFIALGIAQQARQPTVLVCTSGSAVYNFAPSVVEAFFQQVPLLVLSADRPAEWIHQYDGQTIFQSGIFGKHVKSSFEIVVDDRHADALWHSNRVANEAYLLATAVPLGPVHINIPIREPFYPTETDVWRKSATVRAIAKTDAVPQLSTTHWHSLLDTWDSYDKILIAIGQLPWNDAYWNSLSNLAEDLAIPVVADVISNVDLPEYVIRHHDLFLGAQTDDRLQPELLITAGMSFISKELKLFLRNNPATVHWHISPDGILADPLRSVTEIIPVSPGYFFDTLYEKIDFQNFVENNEADSREAYYALWEEFDLKSSILLDRYIQKLSSLTDLSALDFIFKRLHGPYQLQLGNSMSVRYANVLQLPHPENVVVYANRGTSGIDGCMSTAIGAALAVAMPVYLIIGDISFFYDRNGLLVQHLPENLKIIILNNGGGDIFTMIDGPAKLPENKEFFRTAHSLTAQHTAQDAGVPYIPVTTIDDLQRGVDLLAKATTCVILEVQTVTEDNQAAWKGLKAFLKAHL